MGRAGSARCAWPRAASRSTRSTRARSAPTSCATGGGSRAAPPPSRTSRSTCRRSRRAPKAAPGRRRPPRHPAAVGPEAAHHHRGAVARGSGSDLERIERAVDDIALTVPPGRCADARPDPAAVELRRDRRRLRRARDRRRAGRHDRQPPRDLVRPGDDDRRRDAPRPQHRPAARGALGAEPPAAVRRRRDLARLGDDARPRCARGAPGPRRRDAQPARGRGVRRGRGRRRGASTRWFCAAT